MLTMAVTVIMGKRTVVEGEGGRRPATVAPPEWIQATLVSTESLSMVYMPTYASEHSGLGRMVHKQGNLTLIKVAYWLFRLSHVAPTAPTPSKCKQDHKTCPKYTPVHHYSGLSLEFESWQSYRPEGTLPMHFILEIKANVI